MTKAIEVFEGDYRFLSNFYVHLPDGRSNEHLYQMMKTFDADWQRRIYNAQTPNAAKKLGRQAPLVPHWEAIKVDIMYALCLAKFSRPQMRRQLLNTGTVALVEGNTWGDTFWGVCEGKGDNHLGAILMDVRSVICD
jgi:ribA/ribD-fused uncharacterized protein